MASLLLVTGLFVGGCVPATSTPAPSTWSTAGDMGGLHGVVRASLLQDGRVLVVGLDWGAEVYDPSAA